MKTLRRVLVLAVLTLCIVSTGCDEDGTTLPFAGFAWLPTRPGLSVTPVGSEPILFIPTPATSAAAGGGGR
jgi:hypothetical protein